MFPKTINIKSIEQIPQKIISNSNKQNKLILILQNCHSIKTKMQQRNQSQQWHLRILLVINCIMLVGHMYYDDADIWYFCQLTVIGQILVILNFYLSILLHQDKCNLHTQLFLSRFHLITLALQSIVVIGFWSLRVFFPKGIMEDEERTFIVEFLSAWVHGGSFVTMFYFVRQDQIVTETIKRKKVLFHLFWALPFAFIQWMKWKFTGKHIYGFIRHFDWTQLIVFQLALFFIAVSLDYFISVRHGFNLLKNLQQHGSRSHIHMKLSDKDSVRSDITSGQKDE